MPLAITSRNSEALRARDRHTGLEPDRQSAILAKACIMTINVGTHRLNRDMGVAIYGNYGAPILAFPTSCGDEWEMEGQDILRTLSPYIDQGESASSASTVCRATRSKTRERTPFIGVGCRRSTDAYVANEVFPFIDSQCQTPGIPIATLGASLGAYHAANTLFKHPDHVKRCYALSGIYDMRDSMDGMYDDNFYFNNPVDYMANQNDPWFLHQDGVATSGS